MKEKAHIFICIQENIAADSVWAMHSDLQLLLIHLFSTVLMRKIGRSLVTELRKADALTQVLVFILFYFISFYFILFYFNDVLDAV